jgi:hypothetical protein
MRRAIALPQTHPHRDEIVARVREVEESGLLADDVGEGMDAESLLGQETCDLTFARCVGTGEADDDSGVIRCCDWVQFSPSGGFSSAGGSLGAGSSGAGGVEAPLSAP